MTTPSAAPGLRERKKIMTRSTILSVAEALFEERGYDNVTVAEIADGANVSVKTLFTYFRSKEDLAFGEADWLIDAIVDDLRARDPGISPVDAVAGTLKRLVADPDRPGLGVEGFHRGVGDSLVLESRLLRMWADYEDTLTAELAREAGEASPSPRVRLMAIQLIAILRTVTSQEIRRMLGDLPMESQQGALTAWIDEAASLTAGHVDARLS
ncbi:MAG TPA: helix-turn-helix domain-containing protein [Thermomicrobiales bacterium]|nr:helix-turn-helix domain-containing protein [Thermomicrobiales bacterium]